MILGLAGAALALDQPGDRATLLLAVVLQVLTSPLSSNLLNRASYLATGTREKVRAEVGTRGVHSADPVA